MTNSNNDTFELKVTLDDMAKYTEPYSRVGRAEEIIDALKRALNASQAELRIAQRELRATREMVTR